MNPVRLRRKPKWGSIAIKAPPLSAGIKRKARFVVPV
jgi:hypothetical protein